MKREEPTVSLKPVHVVLQSVTPQEKEARQRVGVVCQLTVVDKHRLRYNQLFE